MSRARKADHKTVIDAAQAVFWEHGYQGASTRQIEERTGLTRFTLQTSYGGKEAFFLETLDAYMSRVEAEHLPDAGSTNLEELAQWFADRADPAAMPQIGAQGCLLLNAITEFDRNGGEVDVRIAHYFEVLHHRFAQILGKAIETGEVAADFDPDEKATLLQNTLLGLSLTIKARPNDAFAQPFAAAAAAMIRQWRVVG
ncbi:TetR/AcrR family transcriptional regulator [Parasedimentitalea huanghaiensis]|uniref:TetR family transcriptional regulator n=1 Tax=Parasedimentitalea huanghaiensis TaxID=2682100 RepID=A0A6L6WFT0_9RHOB|nr:TetR/AcrR family transcriptional regulator [Zongyanglinia huanghaiensis]MVO16320.1 TetR family transcriptional regulator [Zongyanglinia huanghaiensis]